jgi:hypothetical protein
VASECVPIGGKIEVLRRSVQNVRCKEGGELWTVAEGA